MTPDHELWLLNFYRNSELHGALLMGRLARTVSDADIVGHATRHCATEARHAAMLTGLLESLGARLDPRLETIQQHYSARGGVPTALVDVLVLSEVLERRVLATYREHVARGEAHPEVRRTLNAILDEMAAEEHGHGGSWIERALQARPKAPVEAAETKWRAIDAALAAELPRAVAARVVERS